MEQNNVLNFSDQHLSDQDMVDLFMGLFRLIRRQYQSQIEALKKQITELKREKQQELELNVPLPS